MNEFVAFIVAVWEQQSKLEPVTQAFFWMLFWLTTMITCILAVAVVLHICDFGKWLVNCVKAHRKWQKERKFFQKINRIKNESYNPNRSR